MSLSVAFQELVVLLTGPNGTPFHPHVSNEGTKRFFLGQAGKLTTYRKDTYADLQINCPAISGQTSFSRDEVSSAVDTPKLLVSGLYTEI